MHTYIYDLSGWKKALLQQFPIVYFFIYIYLALISSLTCRKGKWGGENPWWHMQHAAVKRQQSGLSEQAWSLSCSKSSCACKQLGLIAWVFQSSHFSVCFDSDANRRLTSPSVSKPGFSPAADLWSLGTANGKAIKKRIKFMWCCFLQDWQQH